MFLKIIYTKSVSIIENISSEKLKVVLSGYSKSIRTVEKFSQY